MVFIAPPALAPAAISHPGGTVVEVVQGDEFTLGFRLRWDEAAKGYFAVAISWDSPRLDNAGTPSENFTFVSATAYFDNGDPIYVEARLAEGTAPENENVWRYVLSVGHAEGDPRNGEFSVDIVLRAAGAGGLFHVPTENHPITIVGTIDVAEGILHSFTPPNPVITAKVLKPGTPTDDATVRSEWPNQNFGSENSLKVYYTPGGEARAFLKFSLTSIPSNASIISASLKLYCYEMYWGMWPMEVCAVGNDSWSEGAITWNNQPPYGAPLSGYEGSTGEWWVQGRAAPREQADQPREARGDRRGGQRDRHGSDLHRHEDRALGQDTEDHGQVAVRWRSRKGTHSGRKSWP
ncbi:MAG: DNRLRE domain-containing protein [Candidatus Hodarchaeaceae archaeon]|nr:DNRLRE domain-containing protein [Candidatus Hodarchaeaceae archaeon]